MIRICDLRGKENVLRNEKKNNIKINQSRILNRKLEKQTKIIVKRVRKSLETTYQDNHFIIY